MLKELAGLEALEGGLGGWRLFQMLHLLLVWSHSCDREAELQEGGGGC